MIDNAISQTEGSVSASILGDATLRNPFLTVDDGISVRESAVQLLPACTILRVAGFAEMTAANGNLFRKKACAAWNGHTDVEIDLSETTFIDCAGLGALIAVRNLTQEHHGVARIMNPTSSVRRMLDLTSTGQLFAIVNTPNADPAFDVPGHN
jgi:anti-anti-sigma factor